MKRLLAIGLYVGSLVGFGTAQPVPERSYLLTSKDGLFQVDFATKRLTTLFALPSSTATFDGITMQVVNQSAAILFNDGADPRILSYTPQRGLTTLVRRVSPADPLTGVALDQDGRLVLTTDQGLFKTTGFLNNTTTLLAGQNNANGICLDDDTGDFVIASNAIALSHLMRVTKDGANVGGIVSGIGFVKAVEHDQQTGNFAITTSLSPTVRIYSRSGQLLASRDVPGADTLKLDDLTGRVHVATDDGILVLDRGLALLDTFGPYPVGFTGLEIWGSRKVGPASSLSHAGGTRGAMYAVHGQFHDSPNQSYASAISLAGLRPGIPTTDGRMINVLPDALFFATVEGLVPFFTIGFVGTTSSSGSFAARFLVPQLPVGTTIHYVAGVVNSTKPSNLDLAPALCIQVRP